MKTENMSVWSCSPFHHLHFPQTTINVSQCSNVHPRLVSGRWLVRRFFSFSPRHSSTLPKPPPAKETIAQQVISNPISIWTLRKTIIYYLNLSQISSILFEFLLAFPLQDSLSAEGVELEPALKLSQLISAMSSLLFLIQVREERLYNFRCFLYIMKTRDKRGKKRKNQPN